jgi:molecular chaperone DnaJ
MPRDYYEVLGVDRGAGTDEIKRSFRRLARELHPDVNDHDPEAEEKFKEAAEAYEVLSDPERRRTYDTFGHQGVRAGGWAPRTEGFGNLQDIFQAFFGGDPFGFGQGGPAQGGDVGAAIEVSLAEVLEGTTREVSFEAVTLCERCRGNGAEPGTPIRTCENCDGTGQVRELRRSVFGQVMTASSCPVCGGDGRVPETPCERCEGAGRLVETRTWEVDVPPGIEDGQRIRIAGAGHAGERGGGLGDLYVEVRVAADERFARQGTELAVRAPLPVTTAMLGGEIEVPTLSGERTLEVEPGTQHGEAAVLTGEGLPPLRGGPRGDLHVVFELTVPDELTDEQRGLVRRLAEALDPRTRGAASGDPGE